MIVSANDWGGGYVTISGSTPLGSLVVDIDDEGFLATIYTHNGGESHMIQSDKIEDLAMWLLIAQEYERSQI